jgi:hypothetical protein
VVKDTPSLMIDCITRDERVHGFPYSQLINYVLESNPTFQSNRDAPPERLTIGFSSHDVVVLGWRMRGLTTLLHDAKAGTIRTIDGRYGNLNQVEPFIAEIIVTPIKGIS